MATHKLPPPPPPSKSIPFPKSKSPKKTTIITGGLIEIIRLLCIFLVVIIALCLLFRYVSVTYTHTQTKESPHTITLFSHAISYKTAA